jgi:hypothetical protein
MFPRTAREWNRFSKYMMVVSLIPIVTGAVFAARTCHFLQRAVAGKGTIVKLMEKESDGGRTLYAPVFTFADTGGSTYEAFSSTARYPPVGCVGDKIDILYDPKDPWHVEERGFFSLWAFAAIPGGLGALYFLLFWSIAFFTRRKTQSANKG